MLFLHPEIRKMDVINYGYLKDWQTTFMGLPYLPDINYFRSLYNDLSLKNMDKTIVKSWLRKLFDETSMNFPCYPKLTDNFLKNFDAIITIDFHTFYSYYVAKAARRLGIKHVVRSHNFYNSPINFIPTYIKNSKFVFSNSSGVVYVTEASRRYIKRSLGDHPHYIVSYLGLDPNEIKKIKKSSLISAAIEPDPTKTNILNIIYVGRLEKEKGIKPLVKAVRHLQRNGTEVNLTIIGSGKLSNYIKKSLTKYKNLRYLGSIYDEAKWIELIKSDLFIGVSGAKRKLGFTIWKEDVGHTVIEAMASGLAVIGGKNGAHQEIIGNSGFVVSQNFKEIAHAVNMIINIGIDSFKEQSLIRFNKFFDSTQNSAQLNTFFNDMCDR